MLGWHLTIRLRDDRVITPSRSARRRAVRIVIEQARACEMIAFHIADTHIHVLVLCDRAEAGKLARRIELAIGWGLPRAFSRARLEPLRDQAHLRNAFDYVLRQAEHHGVLSDPFHDGSAVLDVLGLRAIDARLPHRVRERLPRVTRADLLLRLGVPALEPHLALDGLAEAACAAFALDTLNARDPGTVRARRAAVAAAARASTRDIAAALGADATTIRRLAEAVTPAAADVRAVRLQMGLRAMRADEPAFVREPAAPAWAC